jgi:hypothetical protein
MKKIVEKTDPPSIVNSGSRRKTLAVYMKPKVAGIGDSTSTFVIE